jgi:LuxR family transcriptional regulator, maltose regulon positive regulatory protein
MTSTMSRPEASPETPRGRANGRAKERPRLLEDKLQIPQSHFPVLRRRRLSGLIEQATRHRVTLVSAPAGAGKTVACATWAAANPEQRRVVWLTLDAGDQNSWFWAYVCAGLTRLRAAPADALRCLEDSSPEGFPLRLVEAAQLFTEPVILVLDDVHEVTDEAVLAGLDLLIRHAPGSLRLVLVARQPPALQLARLRVAGELADIGGADLACTPDEADAYFAMLGMDVDRAARDELLRRTEGWMAGLRLAAMRAVDGPGSGTKITDLAGDQPMVTDYLWDEVLGRQPAQTRMFLLRTSITEDVSGDLADALTGQSGGARTLDRLNRENSFVDALDRERGEYRYHPLLREVLTAELQREIPHEMPVLLRRAARWYAAHGRPIDGVRCAAEAEDWDYAAQVLAEAGAGAATLDRASELESVLALFPAERSADDPAVAAAWAAARLWDGDREGAASYLDSAQRGVERAVPAMRRIMEPTLAALRVMHASGRTDPDPALLAAGQSLAERSQPAVSTQPEHRGIGLLWFALGTASLRRWEIQAARGALRRADRELGAGGLVGFQARARAWRALAEAWHGDLGAAERSARDVRATAASGALAICGTGSAYGAGAAYGASATQGRSAIAGAGEASLLAGLACAQVSLGRDDLSTAQRLLDEVDKERTGQIPGEPPVSALAALIRARVLLADGDCTAATAMLSRLRETWGPAHPALSDVITVAEGEVALRAGNTGRARAILLLVEEGEHFDRASGRLLRGGLSIAVGDFTAALETVQPCLEAASGEAGGGVTRHQQISALLLAAVAHRRLGSAQEAAGLVERALALAEPDSAYRVFLDGGAAVRSAMTVLIPPTSRHAGFAGRILERFEAQAPRPAGALEQASVPLTDSERAVLCFLPSHMTNEEISQALFLSINTVKTHLRSAYRKLGVGSRREAIARGRRMGLLLSAIRGSVRGVSAWRCTHLNAVRSNDPSDRPLDLRP